MYDYLYAWRVVHSGLVRYDSGLSVHGSYGVFALRTLLEYLSGIYIQMVQLLGIMMDIFIPTDDLFLSGYEWT